MKSALFIFSLFKSAPSFIVCSNVGVLGLVVEEDEKCVVYLLPFQVSFILHSVQQCRSGVADSGGG